MAVVAFGLITGVVLALTGAGGGILPVPMLVFGVTVIKVSLRQDPLHCSQWERRPRSDGLVDKRDAR
jgi:hypothetical protein